MDKELARIVDIQLELNVNFDRSVLQGKAILTVEREFSAQKIVLDNFKLAIKSVRNFPNVESYLSYNIGTHNASGSSLTIELSRISDIVDIADIDNKFRCQIQIEYETSPDSPALHWLTPAQTADGLYPFLLSYNMLIYARAWFPCQDTPSVKFTYSATISVPKNFTVVMSALLQKVSEDPETDVYEFLQEIPVPSYAVIIAVGSLKRRQLSERSNIFAENKFIDESFNTFRSNTFESMLQIAESLCGSYFGDKYDLCVLPPSIAHFEIECLCVAFISPALLRGDRSGICYSLSRTISRNWAGILVTCSNYNNFWLNKSFSIFISRKIICKMLINEEMKCLLKKLGIEVLNYMIQELGDAGFLKCLIPNLSKYLWPHVITKYVPYETGCMLLYDLENMLGGPSAFEPFLQSYFHAFAFKSINTNDWMNCLYQKFPGKKEMLDSIGWNSWFYDTIPQPNMPGMTSWETECFELTEELVNWNGASNIPSIIMDRRNLCDFQKILLLCKLYKYSAYLTERKLKLLSDLYFFDIHSGQIRWPWLLLCIKVRWAEKIESALNFAIEFCSTTIACSIFRHLYEWEEIREEVLETYDRNKGKMLNDTQRHLDIILHIN